MQISAKRMAILREHIRAESVHDMDALIGGMTSDCFNDVVGASEPFVGPKQTAERPPQERPEMSAAPLILRDNARFVGA